MGAGTVRYNADNARKGINTMPPSQRFSWQHTWMRKVLPGNERVTNREAFYLPPL